MTRRTLIVLTLAWAFLPMRWHIWKWDGRRYRRLGIALEIPLSLSWHYYGSRPHPSWAGYCYAVASRPFRDWQELQAWMDARYGTPSRRAWL